MPELDPLLSTQLRRARRRVVASALAGPLITAPIGIISLFLGAALAKDVRPTFAMITLPVGLIAFFVLWILLYRGTRQVARVARGARSPEALAAAVLSLSELPHDARRWCASCLGAGVSLDCVLWPLFVRGFGWDRVVTAIVTGVAIVNIASFLCGTYVQRTIRRPIRLLMSAGLSPDEVLRVLTPGKSSFRRFLVTFVGLLTVAPSVLISMAILLRAGEADLSVSRFEWGATVIVVLTGVIIAVTAWFAARGLSVPMLEISARAEQIRKGVLDTPTLVQGEGEVWAMSVAFMRLQRQLRDAVGQLGQATGRLHHSTDHLLQTFAGQDVGANEQATALNETSATTEELARSAGQIAENASEVAEVAERTLLAAQKGQRSADAFFGSMVRMRQQNQTVADAVVRLNKRVQQIGKVVEFIDEIADKSDLLALNAELEGTKAGEVGRGFSLVAAEMRRLSEDVMRSTKQIERLITDIRDATNSAVMATEAGVKATNAGTAAANEVGERLRGILDQARETSDSVRSISLATQQQQTGTRQLAEAMAEILRVTEEGALASRLIQGANVDLSALAKTLQDSVARFDLKNASPEGTP